MDASIRAFKMHWGRDGKQERHRKRNASLGMTVGHIAPRARGSIFFRFHNPS